MNIYAWATQPEVASVPRQPIIHRAAVFANTHVSDGPFESLAGSHRGKFPPTMMYDRYFWFAHAAQPSRSEGCEGWEKIPKTN